MNFTLYITLFSVMVGCLITCVQPVTHTTEPTPKTVNEVEIDHKTPQNLQGNTAKPSLPPNHEVSAETLAHKSVMTQERNILDDTLPGFSGTVSGSQGIPPDAAIKKEQRLESHSEHTIGAKQAEFVQRNREPHIERNFRFPSNNVHPEKPISADLRGLGPHSTIDSNYSFEGNQLPDAVLPSSSSNKKRTDSFPSHPSVQRNTYQFQDDSFPSPVPYGNFRDYHEHVASYDERIPKEDDFVSLTIVLPAASKLCLFYSPITNFVIEYQVIRGGNLDVGLTVKDPDEEPVVKRDYSPDASLAIGVPHRLAFRPYSVCFDNRKASYAEKHVAFSIDLDVNWDNPLPHELAAIERLRKRHFAETQLEHADHDYFETWKSVMTQLNGLFSRMRLTTHLQQKSNNFASVDQSLMEANLYRVTSGSVLQILTMLTVASAQILLLRALFDPTSRLYRLWFGTRSAVSARC